jgi:hypothetical protein
MRLIAWFPFRVFLTLTASPLAIVARGPTTTLAAPPDFPDPAHVANGCYLSTVAFLSRFAAEFPDERAQALVVTVATADTRESLHTIAVVTWRGEWWGRDEYCGLFRVGTRVDPRLSDEQLAKKAGAALQRHGTAQARAGTKFPAKGIASALAMHERAEQVALAQTLVPMPSVRVWVRSGETELPFLFFAPKTGAIAVYDPSFGTATAECAATEPRQIVAMVATRLGYKVDAVRAEPLSPVRELIVAMR